ncbi:glycosyltransferase [Calothrix sp. PCC 7507]|uniref:glycosyltransferase n=1 Tax=Calothrix sp. PCC 7507 TaxID=99598 RepID=UPI00029F3ABD|nr:glycosyltransferase [Calothrix sp. PCC 7507]AFY36218.1 glycosyl transferase group 1 [Calothrix sp. PCC 7507]
MKTIALFDNYRDGHHFTYLTFFSKTLLEMGYLVMVFCQYPDELNKWIALNCPEHVGQIFTFKVTSVKTPSFPIIRRFYRTLNVLQQWQYAAKMIQWGASQIGHSPDLVFFAWLDNYLSHYLTHHIIDLIFPYQWSGLYFHPTHLRTGQLLLPILRTPLSHYSVTHSSRCCGIALLDDVEVQKLKQKLNKLVITFPDFTDESTPDSNYIVIKQIKEKAGNKKIIGLLGGLTQRKGLFTLLEIAQNSIEENWFFVFAGRLYEDDLQPEQVRKVWNIIESAPPNCFFHLERIPNETQFNAVIDICDILYAVYEDFPFSSNILTKAAVFEKLVIVSERFYMGEVVKKFQMGISIPEKNMDKSIESIQILCHHLDTHNYNLKPDFEGYKYTQSVLRLREAFSLLCEKAFD